MCKAQVELGIGDDIVWNGKFGQYKLKGYSQILSQLFKVPLWQHKKGSETSLWHFLDVLSIYKNKKSRNSEFFNSLDEFQCRFWSLCLKKIYILGYSISTLKKDIYSTKYPLTCTLNSVNTLYWS